ncbi:MAG: hypothetical protein WAW92_04300 [Minisyncoccia bacterium]
MKNSTRHEITLEQSVERVTEVIAAMKSFMDFKVGDPVAGWVRQMAEAIEQNDAKTALARGGDIVSVGRSILGKYVRNSVFDQMTDDGQMVREAHFNKELRLRVEEGYDEDIVGGLRKAHTRVLEAVRLETNGTFDLRRDAHNAMQKCLAEADVVQRRRDNVRVVREREAQRVAKKAKDARATELNRVAAQTQREKILAARRETAGHLISLLS